MQNFLEVCSFCRFEHADINPGRCALDWLLTRTGTWERGTSGSFLVETRIIDPKMGATNEQEALPKELQLRLQLEGSSISVSKVEIML